MSLPGVDPLRVGPGNAAPIRNEGKYVLYWMSGARRLDANPSLDAAVAQARALRKPLLVFEAIACNYRFASPRHHRFVVDAMADQRRRLEALQIRYLPLVEREPGQVRALLLSLFQEAAVVIGDQHPGGWLRTVTERAVEVLNVRTQLIDSVGLVPLALAEKNYVRAFDYRRMIGKELCSVVGAFPRKLSLEDPGLKNAPLPASLRDHSVLAATQALLDQPQTLSSYLDLPGPAACGLQGGHAAASSAWTSFLHDQLAHYGEQRHHPDAKVESRQSPYLHYGHIGAHELLESILAQQDLSLDAWVQAVPKAVADKSSRWGLPPGADGYVDQLMVWRELGQHLAHRRPDAYDTYQVLPVWARTSLQEHAMDPREANLSLEALEASQSPDPVWNAAQTQLREEGHIHNYLRMLWGKRMLAWTPTPQEAFERLVILNNRYALDGRDPNSHSGIGWIFGLFDRPWGPERPIYGKIRYMTTQSTLRKLRLKQYLAQYGQPAVQAQLF